MYYLCAWDEVCVFWILGVVGEEVKIEMVAL